MTKKTRGEQPRGTLGKKDVGGIPETWPKDEASRHKWFRKRNKGKTSRRSRFDDESDGEAEDEFDDEADEEDVESGLSLCESHIALSEAAAQSGEEILARATREDVWGIASSIDIYDCNPELIRDSDAIRRFVVELCDLIEMKRFGETQVVHFGEDERVAGYSMVQLIETSLISAHFANQTNAVYLDVFSCKPYNPQIAREFSQAFFCGRESSLQVALRR